MLENKMRLTEKYKRLANENTDCTNHILNEIEILQRRLNESVKHDQD